MLGPEQVRNGSSKIEGATEKKNVVQKGSDL